jgi:ABC-type lipoprotein release transport system permease subunit
MGGSVPLLVLLTSPGFTIVAVLMLTFGIAATLALTVSAIPAARAASTAPAPVLRRS